MDATLLVVALLIALVLAFLLLRRPAVQRGNVVLLVGPCGAGKTLAFLQLRDRRDIPTHMSMAVNEDTFELKKGGTPVLVVDCPGAPQLQADYLKRISTAGAIVFMVDSADPLAQSKLAGGMLYEIFVSDAMRRLHVPVLLACNKSDSARAMPSAQLRAQIEKEIDRIQRSRSTMQDLSDKTQGSMISQGSAAFTFKDVSAPNAARREETRRARLAHAVA